MAQDNVTFGVTSEQNFGRYCTLQMQVNDSVRLNSIEGITLKWPLLGMKLREAYAPEHNRLRLVSRL